MTLTAPSSNLTIRKVSNNALSPGYALELTSIKVKDGTLAMMVMRELFFPIRLPVIDH